MATFKITGESRSVFGEEHFSRAVRFSTYREEQRYEETGRYAKMPYRFRCCDDDGITYFWGVCSTDSSFAPLDEVGVAYGCTYIEYKNVATGCYEAL